MTTKKSKTNTLVNRSKDEEVTLKIIEKVNFAGDIKLQIKTPTTFDAQTLATFSFNTAFIGEEIIIPLADLSPYSLRKSGDFGEDFCVKMTFEPICTCNREI